MSENMTFAKLLQEIEEALRQASCKNPVFEAKYILSSVLNIRIPEIFIIDKSRPPTQCEIREVREATEKRAKHGIPLQYIFGKAYFRSLELEVSPSVLIPRPETEELVELALKKLPKKAKVLDIGTGSGAIAISIATEAPETEVFATDKSPSAILIAEKNRNRFSVNNLHLIVGDMFQPFRHSEHLFDAILANLPYIREDKLPELSKDVRDFEPHEALISGEDGLDAIRKFVAEAWQFMKPSAFALLEISPEQCEPLTLEIKRTQKYSNPEFYRDFNGLERFCQFYLTQVD